MQVQKSKPGPNEILAVAAKLFAERGYSNVSIRDVCKHAKTSAPMIYYYFKDHKGQWRWLLKASNGRPIAASGEAYEDEKDCLYDIELVKASSGCLVKKQAMSAHQ